jgi:hypothetical protein
MRELRESDAFPVGDVALLRALANLSGVRLTPQDMVKRAERWRPWRAYATIHLWASLADTAARSPALAAGEARARKSSRTAPGASKAAVASRPTAASAQSSPRKQHTSRKPSGTANDRRRAA